MQTSWCVSFKGSDGVAEHEAAVSLFSRMTAFDKAMVRSQAGLNAGVALSTCPCSPLSRIESPLFRVLLQRRFSLPFPLSNRICRCGLPNDQFGHHFAACSRTWLLGRRGFPFESAVARICREAGGRVATNMFVRNMNFGAPNAVKLLAKAKVRSVSTTDPNVFGMLWGCFF